MQQQNSEVDVNVLVSLYNQKLAQASNQVTTSMAREANRGLTHRVTSGGQRHCQWSANHRLRPFRITCFMGECLTTHPGPTREGFLFDAWGSIFKMPIHFPLKLTL